MHKRTKRLREIMTQKNITVAEVATMLGRTPQTVRTWRVATGGNARVIPAHLLELLELKTK